MNCLKKKSQEENRFDKFDMLACVRRQLDRGRIVDRANELKIFSLKCYINIYIYIYIYILNSQHRKRLSLKFLSNQT